MEFTIRKTGREAARYYLRRSANMVQAGMIRKLDLSTVWLRPGPSSRILETFRREIMKCIRRNNTNVIDNTILSLAVDRTVLLHSSEANLQRGRLGLMPGTFDPIHSGHLYSAFAAASCRRLGGVVLAIGGKIPDKLEVTAFEHRQKMIIICTKGDYNGWIAQTPLRRDIAVLLEQNFLAQSEDQQDQVGAGESQIDAFERRHLSDIVAFNLLFAMNPNISWTYIIGSDKVNKYGIADEEDLVNKTLARRGVEIAFLARSGESVDEASIRLRPWLHALWEQGMFHKVDSSFYKGTSATAIRDGIAVGNPKIQNEVEPTVLNYALSHGLRDLYIFSRAVRMGIIGRQSEKYKTAMTTFKLAELV